MQLVFPSLLAFVAYVAAQGGLTINTPASVVQCQPAQITWTATNTPVFLSIIPGGMPGAAALEDFGSQSGSSLTWTVNLAAGTSITFQIRDSTGAVAYSAPTTIQGSSDSSCVGQQPSTSAGGSASPSATGSASQPATSSVAETSSAIASSASSVSTSLEASTSSVVASVSSAIASATSPRPSSSVSSTRSAAATSSSPSASSAPNSARSNAQVGFAGLLGLVAAAFMA